MPNSVLDLALRLWYVAMCFAMAPVLWDAVQVNTGRYTDWESRARIEATLA